MIQNNIKLKLKEKNEYWNKLRKLKWQNKIWKYTCM